MRLPVQRRQVLPVKTCGKRAIFKKSLVYTFCSGEQSTEDNPTENRYSCICGFALIHRCLLGAHRLLFRRYCPDRQ